MIKKGVSLTARPLGVTRVISNIKLNRKHKDSRFSQRWGCLQPWRWTQYVSSERCHLPTNVNGAKTEKSNNSNHKVQFRFVLANMTNFKETAGLPIAAIWYRLDYLLLLHGIFWTTTCNYTTKYYGIITCYVASFLFCFWTWNRVCSCRLTQRVS